MPLVRPGPVRPRYHRLPVGAVEPLTPRAVAVTFAVPPGLAAAYRFRAGQHLTLRVGVGGEVVRNSYSIAQPATGQPPRTLRIGVQHVPHGRLSPWLVTGLAAGETVDVLPPLGQMCLRPEPAAARHHLCLAGGSGITPLLSICATALADEPGSRVTLVQVARSARDAMFAAELTALADRYAARLALVPVHSRVSGRLDGPGLAGIVGAVGVPDQAWLCGPSGLVALGHEVLADLGVPAEHRRDEVFWVNDARS